MVCFLNICIDYKESIKLNIMYLFICFRTPLEWLKENSTYKNAYYRKREYCQIQMPQLLQKVRFSI